MRARARAEHGGGLRRGVGSHQHIFAEVAERPPVDVDVVHGAQRVPHLPPARASADRRQVGPAGGGRRWRRGQRGECVYDWSVLDPERWEHADVRHLVVDVRVKGGPTTRA